MPMSVYTKNLSLKANVHSNYFFLDFYWKARAAIEHTEDNVRR
jgi:hypothetical protein